MQHFFSQVWGEHNYINKQNKNQAWSEGETKNNKQKIYIS